MVAWLHCPNCKKPVDEFENKCFYCGSKEGVKKLKDFWKNDSKKNDLTIKEKSVECSFGFKTNQC